MRYARMLPPLAVLGLAGCVAVGGPTPRRTSGIELTPARSVAYMTPEQSASFISMPGDGPALPGNEAGPAPYEDNPLPDADMPLHAAP
jgi:hypothetical protein